MAGLKDRTNPALVVEAPQTVAPKTTAELLADAGLLPDQENARCMMEAARLWLPLKATQQRIESAWLRRLVRPKWTVFSLEGYRSLKKGYDSPIPSEMMDRVRQIMAIDPGAIFNVHAMRGWDPWLTVVDRPRNLIIGGWRRDRFSRAIILL